MVVTRYLNNKEISLEELKKQQITNDTIEHIFKMVLNRLNHTELK